VCFWELAMILFGVVCFLFDFFVWFSEFLLFVSVGVACPPDSPYFFLLNQAVAVYFYIYIYIGNDNSKESGEKSLCAARRSGRLA
jgi:hypothetical protein